MAESLRKDALIAELAVARDRLGGHALGLRRNLSPAEAIKRGTHRYPAAWFGGAVLVGLLLSRIPARRKEVKLEPSMPRRDNKKQAGGAGQVAIAVTLVKFALDMAKPSLMRWVRSRVESYGSRSASTPKEPAGIDPAATLPQRESLAALPPSQRPRSLEVTNAA